MAVPHFSVGIVSRSEGRSAVLSAAYRHCAKMEYDREARVIDYSRKQGLLHEEFAIPPDAPQWLRAMIADRSVAGAVETFWNAVEAFEKRSDAQLAKDVTIALPIELTSEQNIALVRDFVEHHILASGMVADWVYHDTSVASGANSFGSHHDENRIGTRNPHIHLMMTLRPLTEEGFGQKKVLVAGPDGRPLRNDAGKIVYELWAGGTDAFNAFRDGWFDCQNRHLALAGLDIRVDGRSYEKQGIELVPTIHLGVGAKAIERKAAGRKWSPRLKRVELQDKRRAENALRIQRRPEIVLDLITRERSVFDERDVAKVLHRYINDAALFHDLLVRTLQSPDVLRLERDTIDFATGMRVPAKYTTRELIRLEAGMADRAIWLSGRSSHCVRKEGVDATFARHARLSQEQRVAIEHITAEGRIAAVVGRAGTGKTTMMKAAAEAWELAGYRVVGAALAGKAAEGLEKEAGIVSRTLASWELRWNERRDLVDAMTVFVLDEAGMVSSRQMATLVETVTKAGAKLVLIGDPDQLQPIEAGAAFRAIADRIGYAELETIYRQREQWMREASLDLARGRIADAVSAYQANGRVVGSELKAQAIENLIADWDRDYDPVKSSLILAHLRRDVRTLNTMARARLVERGLVGEGFAFQTEEGVRRFAAGDQVVFLKNEGSFGVKNGMIGKVIEATPGRIVVEAGTGAQRRQVIVESRFYRNVDHGYATTIHKSQGATVDRVKVLASLSLDRHLIYVAMTRHREDLAVYYGRRSFAKAGGLVPILSRRNAKETTLDYEQASFYRQALRFAEARGLHIMKVARTLARDRLQLLLRQKQKLTALADRLRAFGTRLGRHVVASPRILESTRQAKPMVAGITTFPKSIEQAVEDRLGADPGLQRQWEEVSTRFHLVYARPEDAFKAIEIDAMLKDGGVAERILARIAEQPESFGALKGKAGLLSSRADREDRARAERNVAALAESLKNYARLRAVAGRKFEAQERGARDKLAVDIPALSENAKQVLERVRDAIDRNALSAALEFALADKMVKAELEGFARAVSERFGERTFLSNAARDTDGQVFRSVTAEMTRERKAEVRTAWNAMRAVQLLAAHERTAEAMKQSETIRQSQRQGVSLK